MIKFAKIFKNKSQLLKWVKKALLSSTELTAFNINLFNINSDLIAIIIHLRAKKHYVQYILLKYIIYSY